MSIITVFGTEILDARPSIIRTKTPLSSHRFKLFLRVLGGPYALCASHHFQPLRLMKTIPLRTRWSATRRSQWLLGKKGCSRVICAPVSQRVAHDPVSFRRLNHAAQGKSMGPDPNAFTWVVFKMTLPVCFEGQLEVK